MESKLDRCVGGRYGQYRFWCIEWMCCGHLWQLLLSKLPEKVQTYVSFVGDALDFNEENRLLRSVSFYHVMKDPSVAERFYDLIEARKDEDD